MGVSSVKYIRAPVICIPSLAGVVRIYRVISPAIGRIISIISSTSTKMNAADFFFIISSPVYGNSSKFDAYRQTESDLPILRYH